MVLLLTFFDDAHILMIGLFNFEGTRRIVSIFRPVDWGQKYFLSLLGKYPVPSHLGQKYYVYDVSC
jgi:hypothetical protein